MTAQVINAEHDNVDQIVSHILDNKIVVMPYGTKQRRVFAMIGLANDEVVKKMKEIKSRAPSQAVAISGIPDVAPLVAELDKTKALVAAAKLLGISPQEIVEKCFEVGAVGLILIAQDWLPKGATMVNEAGETTVLIAGEATDESYDIFPKVYRQLIEKHKKVMVGTSANLHGDDTYHALQQNEALERLKDHVDIFVYDKAKIGVTPIFKHLTSGTMIDLTGDRARVVRWGNIHPDRFKKIFPDLIFEPKKLKHYKGKEKKYHVFIEEIFKPFRKPSSLKS